MHSVSTPSVGAGLRGMGKLVPAVAESSQLRCCLRRACRNVLARTALVGELASKGVGNLVPDEIKQILTLLEGDFVPLELCHRLQPLLETLGGLSKPMSGG